MFGFDLKNSLDDDSFEKINEYNLLEEYEENKIMTPLEAFKISFQLGYICYGGRKNHLDHIKILCVFEKRMISLKSFESILNLAENIPGSTSTQVITCISAVKTGSVLGVASGFIGYILPGMICATIVSIGIFFTKGYIFGNSNQSVIQQVDPTNINYLYILLTGLNQGSLGIFFINGFFYAKKFSGSLFSLFLILMSSILYFLYSSFEYMMLLMLLSGLVSYLQKDQNYTMSLEECRINFHKSVFGKRSLFLYIIIYAVIILSLLFFSSLTTYSIERFFRMGSLSWGGGYSAGPFIITEFAESDLLSELDVLTSFSVMTLLPGPLFNISMLIGTFINGPFSGILSAISLYLPGILFILWALPKIHSLKTNYSLQRFLSGMVCGVIGFTLTAGYKLWTFACLYNSYTSPFYGTLNLMFACFLHLYYGIIEPFVIIFSSLALVFMKLFFNV